MISFVIYITYNVYGFTLGATINHLYLMENFEEQKLIMT